MKVVPFQPRRDTRRCRHCGRPRRPDGAAPIEWRNTIIPAPSEFRAYGLWKEDWKLEDLGPVIAWSCSHDKAEGGEVFVVPVTIYGIPEADEWCVVGKDDRVEGTAYESVTDWVAGLRAWYKTQSPGRPKP